MNDFDRITAIINERIPNPEWAIFFGPSLATSSLEAAKSYVKALSYPVPELDARTRPILLSQFPDHFKIERLARILSAWYFAYNHNFDLFDFEDLQWYGTHETIRTSTGTEFRVHLPNDYFFFTSEQELSCDKRDGTYVVSTTHHQPRVGTRSWNLLLPHPDNDLLVLINLAVEIFNKTFQTQWNIDDLRVACYYAAQERRLDLKIRNTTAKQTVTICFEPGTPHFDNFETESYNYKELMRNYTSTSTSTST